MQNGPIWRGYFNCLHFNKFKSFILGSLIQLIDNDQTDSHREISKSCSSLCGPLAWYQKPCISTLIEFFDGIRNYQFFYLFSLGIHTDASTIQELNNQITTRLFSVWHDHSTVIGHCHYLSLISLIYDPLVYLTADEYKGYV